MQLRGVPTAPFILARTAGRRPELQPALPALRQAGLRGLGQGCQRQEPLHEPERAGQAGGLPARRPTGSRCWSRPTCRAPSSPSPSWATAKKPAASRSSGMRFDELPEGAPPIYGYEAKWIWDRPDDPLEIFECPARVPARLATADPGGRAGRLPRPRMPRLVPGRHPLRRRGNPECGRAEPSARDPSRSRGTTPASPRPPGPRG